ncbi:MAG: MATE family multidrug resistance protein [Bacteroidia bacterium]
MEYGCSLSIKIYYKYDLAIGFKYFCIFKFSIGTCLRMKSIQFKKHFNRNLILAFPVILSQVGQVLVGVVDNLMVGPLGANPLAAASFANAVFFNIMIFGMGIAFGLTPLVGTAFGEKDVKAVGRYFKNGIFINLVTGVLLSVAMYFATFAMPYLGQEEAVVEKAIPYFHLLNASMLPMMLFFHFKQFNEGLESTKPAMFVSVGSNLLNIGLNYVFIYGHFGFEAMGLQGAGLATLISRILTGVGLAIYTLRSSYFKPYIDAMRLVRIRKEACRDILKISLPISGQMLMEMMVFSIGAIMIGWISPEAQAAHQIVIGMVAITFMVATGISSATTIIISNELGKKNFIAMRDAARTAFVMAVGFMAVTAVLFTLWKNWLPSFYVKPEEAEVLTIAASLMAVAGFFQLFDGAQVVALGALRGLKDVKIPTLLTLFAYWFLGLPTSYFLAFKFGLGAKGVWYGFLVGLGSAGIMLSIRFEWIQRRMREKNEEELTNNAVL